MSRKLALIIGNSEYDDSALAKLKAPEADVRALAGLLRDPAIGGFDTADILFNRPFAEVHPAIADFFADKRPDDLLFMYFSGHGALDAQGRLYLGLKNTRRALLSGTAISSSFVKEQMDDSRSRRQVLILDCCHSGAFARGAKGALGAQAITDATFEGHGRVVLTATDITQYAWEGDQVIGETENSLFTHFMIEGLKTGAADTDGDGRITPDELYEFVFGRVVSTTAKQRPRKIVYDQQGDLVIARNPRPVVKPIPLSDDLQSAIEHPSAFVREGAVRELERLLNGSLPGLAHSAHEALLRLKDDDSRRVSAAAVEVLARYEAQRAARKAEEERLARDAERAEQERLAQEKAEQERLAREQAEHERLAQEKAEQERLAREKARQQAIDRERAERLAAQEAEKERLARLNAEQEQRAREQAERERIAREEAERLAKQKAEADRLAQEQAMAERQAGKRTQAGQERPALIEPLRRLKALPVIIGGGLLLALAIFLAIFLQQYLGPTSPELTPPEGTSAGQTEAAPLPRVTQTALPMTNTIEITLVSLRGPSSFLVSAQSQFDVHINYSLVSATSGLLFVSLVRFTDGACQNPGRDALGYSAYSHSSTSVRVDKGANNTIITTPLMTTGYDSPYVSIRAELLDTSGQKTLAEDKRYRVCYQVSSN